MDLKKEGLERMIKPHLKTQYSESLKCPECGAFNSSKDNKRVIRPSNLSAYYICHSCNEKIIPIVHNSSRQIEVRRMWV